MTPLHQNLTRMRLIASDPAKITTGAFARDSKGKAVPPWSKAAQSFDITGLVQHVTPIAAEQGEVLGMLWGRLGGEHMVPRWNDSASHADFLDLLDEAIAIAARRAAA
jgi:hypothetical protein